MDSLREHDLPLFSICLVISTHFVNLILKHSQNCRPCLSGPEELEVKVSGENLCIARFVWNMVNTCPSPGKVGQFWKVLSKHPSSPDNWGSGAAGQNKVHSDYCALSVCRWHLYSRNANLVLTIHERDAKYKNWKYFNLWNIHIQTKCNYKNANKVEFVLKNYWIIINCWPK